MPGLLLNIVLQIVEELGDPYPVRSGLGGMAAYSPRAMAAVCIVMEAERKTYRGMVGHLRSSQNVVRKMGLPRIPSKSTIARAYGLIPDSYLMKAHKMVIREIVAGSVAGDSTGYSNNGLVRWYDVRTDSIKNRKGWVKLHSIIDIRTRVVLDYIVTDSSVADINGLRPMLDRFGGGTGNFCLDAAYLAREICNIIDGKGMTPRICPKSNTVHNAQGSQSWRSMIDLYVSDPTRFKLEYHQRSIIEAVFGAIKKMYGNHIRCRRRGNQYREIAMRIICYNIELVARSQINDGRLTSDMMRTAAVC